MFEFINLLKPKENLKFKKEKLFNKLAKPDENSWLFTNKYYTQTIWSLINGMNLNHLQFFLTTKPILFLNSSGEMASSIHQLNTHHIILIYPKTLKMMEGHQFEKAIAILAHELGHLFHRHAKKKLSSLQAQVQADQFAVEVGYGKELQDVLLENSHFTECQVRIAYLTSQLITQMN